LSHVIAWAWNTIFDPFSIKIFLLLQELETQASLRKVGFI
jgi:hypothetical protein